MLLAAKAQPLAAMLARRVAHTGVRHISYRQAIGLACSAPLHQRRPSPAPVAVSGPRTLTPTRFKSSSSSSFYDKLPGPIKSLLPVVGTASLLFFVAAPALLVFLPPVFLGSMLYLRRVRAKRAKLFEQRWTEMASYHLTVQPAQAAINEQDALKRIVMRRLAEAIQDDEGGIATRLGFKVASSGSSADMSDEERSNVFQRSHLALGEVRKIEEDWRVAAQGIAQSMTVYTLSLIDKNREGLKVADVDIVVKSRPGSKSSTAPGGSRSGTKDVRIEVTSAVGASRSHFVIDGPEAEGDGKVIDIKKKR